MPAVGPRGVMPTGQVSITNNTTGLRKIEYNRTRLRKHPEYGYVTPLETRALVTQDLAPRSVTIRCP
ncbi:MULTISPECIES: hypothetical protein [unclassified Streptomyces]|uniref:hypothetical protein n=1 Tax=unclassified Streptomyces TaxID=2593676 RepID=UPI00131CC1B8|nr:hypothetical protein [Streptomyces sp. CB01635]